MNAMTTPPSSLSLRRWEKSTAIEMPQRRTEEAQGRQQVTFGLLRAIASVLASLLYSAIALFLGAVTLIALVVAVPWLLLAPAILAGFVVRLAGFVLNGLGLL